MNFGLRASAQAMTLGMYKQDIISNNIANASTVGFKANDSFVVALNNKLNAHGSQNVFSGTDQVMYNTYTDQTEGTLRETSRDLDLAINGKGYFLVRGESGIDLTRKGDFTIDASGNIMNTQGQLLLASKGTINVDESVKKVTINKSGEIFMDDEYYDTLILTDVDNPSTNLRKKTNGQYEIINDKDYKWSNANGNMVYQGYLEESNVDTMAQMIKMIENEKYFNLNQKVIGAIDSTLGTSINQVGKG